MRQWRLIYDTPMNGRRNMAVDEAILEAVIAREVPPTLRLYAWHPPCLSIGYGQSSRDADKARIAALGWDWVRRPTGGKAILHTDELTYSVAVAGEHPFATQDIVTSYRTISHALTAALSRLGLMPESKAKDADIKAAGAVCFEVPSHYEITVGGRKLVGSAQMRRHDGVLQHGTLPLTGDISRICDALVYPTEAARTSARAQVHTRALTLEEALGHTVTWQQAADALVQGFREAFGITFTEGALILGEIEHAGLLEAEKYPQVERAHERPIKQR